MIKIKESELRLSFIRSRGPGGQNVNKVSTAVQLKYNIINADIPDAIKKRFCEQYKNKISKNSSINWNKKNNIFFKRILKDFE